MEPEGSLQYSQTPSSDLYPEPGQSNPYIFIYFFKVNFNIVTVAR
jgi:hypothetical protein